MTDYSNTEQIYKTHFLPKNYNAIINPDTIDLLTRDYQHDNLDRIMFANNSASSYSKSFTDRITPEFLAENPTFVIPRIYKSLEEQKQRTQKKAEVFTPTWVINDMNNSVDDGWFSENNPTFTNPFNTSNEDNTWTTNSETIDFEMYGKKAIDYITSIRLEIACGETP